MHQLVEGKERGGGEEERRRTEALKICLRRLSNSPDRFSSLTKSNGVISSALVVIASTSIPSERVV